MRILGIDPGLRVTGFGVIEQTGGKLRYITSGCVRSGGGELALRLKTILDGLAEVIAANRPQEISITQALRSVGIDTYRRRQTRLAARLPTLEEARLLRMARTQPIIETESVDVGGERNVPVTYARTCFRADRLQFVVSD